MSKDRQRPRLGRGLSSLIGLSEPSPAESPAQHPDTGNAPVQFTKASDLLHPVAVALTQPDPNLLEIDVEAVASNPFQPRRQFNDASLAALAASLKSTGLVQPVVVRRIEGGYELIAGERRLRAARLAGLATLPAIVKQIDAPAQAQMALVENIQREDLNPVDRARAYRSLMDNLSLTQAELAHRLGEDRSSVSHFLRLLDLAPAVRDLLADGKISFGHAKLLVGVHLPEKQIALARRTVDEELSVRALEIIIAEVPETPVADGRPVAAPANAHLRDLEHRFTTHLGMKVQIRPSSSAKGRGKLVIQYKTLDEFDLLKERLGVETE